ncbi:MAG: sulfatase-modifying factor protein [Flavobacterium sp. MedPE-SWcel]|uniref:formylglycine-generating enzyme family protein n=1 Tax=uncultured Flavobacterium sp. TaxID=165435 RepID=UPI0009119023|nr:formylglycine-generating enzyme family protein [uncultured Flavobacterium sp.]OIQ15594.1 MAG: sulfatase-modifying factor protein [Flavobacterium sp. MedPE-SWcel]
MLDIFNVAIQMIEIPAGIVSLRDDRTKQEWTVEIAPFLLDKYLVTQELYASVTGESPSTFKGNKKPVEDVSWKDAVTFCNKLSVMQGLEPCYIIDENFEKKMSFNPKANGYRLPTDAEWQYACKANSKEARYGVLDEIAWYKENSEKQTHDVGLKAPNNWGLFDMIGNVWEWCSDIYDEEVYGSYRVLRGGGWYDEARGCMATNRRRSHPVAYKIDDLGFRVARNL